MSAKKAMEKAETIGLHFGAMCDPIKKQLAEQGFTQVPRMLERWQLAADAVVRLSIAGLLSQKEADNARKRLVKLIGKEAEPTPWGWLEP